jgi:arginase
VYEVLQHVHQTIQELRLNKKFPIILAGDHSTAAGTIMGIKSANPEKRLGVIWIDAHADLHTPFTTPSGNMHGMPLAIALAEDNVECAVNQLNEEAVGLWENLKNNGFAGPKLNPEDLVFIAVRDTESPEDTLIQRHDITNYSVAQVRKHGAKQIARKVLEQLEACDVIYISFDVDSMDPNEVSYGTGTPVKNGLFPVEALDIMEELLFSKKVIALEIVEVNPCLDNRQNKMAETTFNILETLVEHIEMLYLKD